METEWRDIRDQTSWTAERFTPAVYQQLMAGKPRMAGARAALEYFGVPKVEARAERYAAAKQEQIVRLIEEGRFMAFPDALRFILAVKGAGIRVAAASSSKNAKLFLERIRLDTFAAEQRLDYDFIHDGMTLAGAVRRRHLRPGLPQGQARPGHLPHRRPGARRPTHRLPRGRGRLQRGPGGQGWQHGGAWGGPPGRPRPAGRGGRRPGRAQPGRRLPAGPGRGSPGGAAGGGGAAPAAHRAAAERLDAGLRRLRPRPPGAS